jgi:hypothetical protein
MTNFPYARTLLLGVGSVLLAAASTSLAGCAPPSGSPAGKAGGKADDASGSQRQTIDTRATFINGHLVRLGHRFTGSRGQGLGLPALDSSLTPAEADPSPAAFPAFPVSAPQVVSEGGPVLAAPRITAITFSNDVHSANVQPGEASVELIETFVQTLGFQPTFWDAVSEYGVGPGSSTGPIRLSEAAPTIIDDSGVTVDPKTGALVPSIQSWLFEKLDGTHPEFGTPDSNTLYAIFYPAPTTVMLGDAAGCDSFGAYHSNIVLPPSDRFPDGISVAYAVMPRCTDKNHPDGALDDLTVSASHEFVEAATDPYPFTTPAFDNVDDDHVAYGVLGGGEVGDMCEFQQPVLAQVHGAPFQIQRVWSNRAAAAGDDPCVPNVEHLPYFTAAPIMTEKLEIAASSDSPVFKTLGAKIPVGTTRTLEIGFSSSAPTSAPWTLQTFDLAGRDHPEFTFCFSSTPPTDGSLPADCGKSITGQNGSKAYLTISIVAEGQQLGLPGLIVLPLVSTLGSQEHWVFSLIQN